ncbi:MAG: hypothetical protein KA027_01515 [Candidatus Methanofastidiosum sp.]|nr:hypothetical protein [Methanofastidiosum sp.]
MDSREKVLSTIFAASTLFSVKSNLQPLDAHENQIDSRKVPLVQVDESLEKTPPEDNTLTPLTYSFPEYSILDNKNNVCTQPISLGESFEKAEDDYDLGDKYDFSEYKNFELDSVEKKDSGFVIKTTEDTMVYLIPINNSYTTRFDENIMQFPIEQGNNFELAEIRTILDEKNEREIEIGIVANTYGGKYVSAVLLSDNKDGEKKSFAVKDEKTLSTVVYVVGRNNIYPNKIINILKAWVNLASFQEKNGPIVANTNYSYMNMIGLTNKENIVEDYIKGLDGGGSHVYAGGVCATATALSSLLHQFEGVNINSAPHTSRYFQGPFSLPPHIVDATVYLGSSGRQDLTWKFSNEELNGYFKMGVNVLPLGLDAKDIGKESDSVGIFTLSLTKEEPIEQTEYLLGTLDGYEQIRENEINRRDPDIKEFESSPESIEIAGLFYGEDNLSRLPENVKYPQVIESLKEFQRIVIDYPSQSDIRFGKYLTSTKWYENMLNKYGEEYMQKALSSLNSIWIEGQPVQCVGFVHMVSMLYPELNAYPLSGMSAGYAYQLIPSIALTYDRKVNLDYGKYSIIAGKDITIDEYQDGDIFVNPYVGLKLNAEGRVDSINGTPTGHVGIVLTKFVDINGNTALLLADSNRSGDGQVRLSIIDGSNFEKFFGKKGKYIIRSGDN